MVFGGWLVKGVGWTSYLEPIRPTLLHGVSVEVRIRNNRNAGFWLGLKMGVSENRGPQYSTLNSRILIIRTPK